MIKILIKLGTNENLLNLIKVISKKKNPIATIILNREIIIPSPFLISMIRKECSLSRPLFDIVLEILLVSKIRLEK